MNVVCQPPFWQTILPLVQFTIVDKSVEVKWLIVLSLKYDTRYCLKPSVILQK
jgi:hypothetical protein